MCVAHIKFIDSDTSQQLFLTEISADTVGSSLTLVRGAPPPPKPPMWQFSHR